VDRSTPATGWLRRRWLVCFLLLAASAAVYSPVVDHPFIDWDDPGYVAQNLHVQAGLSWATLAWSFTTTEQANWHPLTWLSHALDCQLFGLNAGEHHLTSVLIHAINAVLLFLLMEKATGAAGRSFLVAALFALHPFNVDSVAWIAERKNVLSTMFFLLTLGAYGWYARRPEPKRYALLTLLFVLGLAAKPMLVTLPFVLLLLDYWPLQRVAGWSEISEHFPVAQVAPSRLLIDKLPLLVLSALSSAVTIVAQRGAIQPAQVLPYTARLENAVASYALYLLKTVWPSGFAVHYPDPFSTTQVTPPGPAAWAAFAAGGLFLTVGSWLVWRQRRKRRYLITGWLWYLGTMFPVIGIVQVGMQGMADRYAYVPLMGVFVMVIWGIAELADHLRLRPAWRQAPAVVILATLSFLTFRQVGHWRTSYALWSHTLQATRNNFLAYDAVGNLLASQHRPEALHYFEEAARIAPTDPTSHQALAARLEDQGLLTEAIRNYEVVVHGSTNPEQLVFAYVNLSIIFGELGDYPRAHEAFSRALRKDPQQIDAMIRVLAEAVSAHPADEGYLRLGLLLEQAGRSADARATYGQALKLNPNRLEALQALNHLEASGE
jgi:hypothetical protein